MKVYISGPMSNYPDHNFPAFREAAKKLRDAGYDALDPGAKGEIEGWTWEDYLRLDLGEMLTCGGVATLPGWEASRGAKLETYVARELKMPVHDVEVWIKFTKCLFCRTPAKANSCSCPAQCLHWDCPRQLIVKPEVPALIRSQCDSVTQPEGIPA